MSLDHPAAPALERTSLATLAALGAGAAALLWPPLALLALAILGAGALMRGPRRLNAAALLGPVLAACAVGAFAGLAGAVGVIFIWRLFEDARWSAAHAARLSGRATRGLRLADAHVWLTPLYGATVAAFTAPHMIAGLPLDLPHAPLWVPLAAGLLAGGAIFDWALRQAVDWRLGQLAVAASAHLLAHHALFLLAFGVGLDVSAGIVALIAWRLAHAAELRWPQLSFTAVP